MYRNEIELVCKDLAIDPDSLDWYWHQAKTIPGTKGWYGVHRQRSTQKPLIEIAVGPVNGYGQVVRTITHELRHQWQWFTGVLQRREAGYYTWGGTVFAPQPRRFRKLPYNQRPQEIDARAYEKDAWVRLFNGGRLLQSPVEQLNDLFM